MEVRNRLSRHEIRGIIPASLCCPAVTCISCTSTSDITFPLTACFQVPPPESESKRRKKGEKKRGRPMRDLEMPSPTVCPSARRCGVTRPADADAFPPLSVCPSSPARPKSRKGEEGGGSFLALHSISVPIGLCSPLHFSSLLRLGRGGPSSRLSSRALEGFKKKKQRGLLCACSQGQYPPSRAKAA